MEVLLLLLLKSKVKKVRGPKCKFSSPFSSFPVAAPLLHVISCFFSSFFIVPICFFLFFSSGPATSTLQHFQLSDQPQQKQQVATARTAAAVVKQGSHWVALRSVFRQSSSISGGKSWR